MKGCIKDDGCDNRCEGCQPQEDGYILVYHFTFDLKYGRALLAEQIEAKACWYLEDYRRPQPSLITVTGIGGHDAHLLPDPANDYERQIWAQAIYALERQALHIAREWDRKDAHERIGNGNWFGDFRTIEGGRTL